MDSVLDFLFLRRLKFEYTSPPICPITPASGSSFGVTGQVISPILAMGAPNVNGRFLTWPCGEGEICFNMYFVNGGFLTEVATCIQPNTVLVCSAGCWQASAVINGIEGPLTAPICTDGTRPTEIPLPASAGVQQYRLYKDSVLVLQSTFCAAFETCTLGCYSVTAITGDGETPPSPVACNGGDPTISITSPADGSSFDLPVSTTITAAINTNGHLPMKVDFYDGALLLGTVTGVGPTYSIPWNPSLLGTHTLTATLTYDGILTVTSAPVHVTLDVILPGANDLLQQTESFDFDSTADNSEISVWLDKTPHINNWVSSPGTRPHVDGTRLLGGHKTVRFNGGSSAGGIFTSLGKFIPNGLTGMELIVIYKADADPPVNRNPVITYQETANIAGLVSTWADQPASGAASGCGTIFSETFCTNSPAIFGWDGCGWNPNIGLPSTNTATAFVCYNLSVESGLSYDAWMNSEHFYTKPGGKPFLTQGIESLYTCGWGLASNGGSDYFAGNIAAVYLWSRSLTPTERAQMRVYVNAKWGITF